MALVADLEGVARLRSETTLALPAPSTLNGESQVTAQTSAGPVSLKWVALGSERDWLAAGTTRSAKR